MMAIVCGLSASAYKLTYEWDEPGSVKIKTGGLTNDFVDIAPDATSWTLEAEGMSYVYVFANGDYFLTSLTMPDGTVKTAQSNTTYGRYAGGFISSTNLDVWDGKTVKVNLTKINRTSEFNFDVINGVDCFTATFSGSGYALDLKKGENKVMYDPSIDTNLQIAYVNGSIAGNPSPAIYSVTYDGTAVEKAKYYERWDIAAVEPGKTVEVRVFEGEEPVITMCELTLEMPADIDGCVASIRDWTKSAFITPVDGKLTVAENTDLALNFNTDDYDVTDVFYNGTSLKDKFQLSGARCRFTVTESGTLQIVGTPKEIPATEFTGYIMNAEGVNLEIGYESGEYVELGEGEAVTGNIKISGATMTAADTKMFTFTVTSKNPLVFVSPKEGWYISTVQYKDGTSYEVQPSALNSDNTTFYIIAKKLENSYTATFDVIGDKSLRLSASTAISGNWNNPVTQYSLHSGTQEISFIPGYDLPLTLRTLEGFDNFQVYIDGKVAPTSEDNEDAYVLNPYYPATASDAQLHSTVKVYADGTSKGQVGSVTLKATGVTTKMYYSELHQSAGTSVSLLYGTPVYIAPATTDCVIKVGNTMVHGTDANGNTVNGLNANGEYEMTVDAAMTTVTVTAQPKYFDIIKISPADGSTVNAFSSVKVYVPMEIGTNYNMAYTSEALIKKISLTEEGGATVYATGLDEPSQDWQTQAMVYTALFDNIDKAGVYTLDIPAGTFFEAEYDEDWGYVEADNGATSKALKATITIDPSAKSPMDIYTLKPASGSALKSLKVVYLNMTEYGPYDMVQIADPVQGSFTNGKTTYDVMIGYDWDNVDTRSFMIIPTNEDYEEITITEDGEWTLYLAPGTFSFDDEVSKAIEATFNISSSYPAYPITPAPGSVTGNLSKFTIDFINVEEVEYNDTYITLAGDDNNFTANTSAVSGTNPYTIQFARIPSDAGEYTLTIPAGAFTLDGQASEEVVAKYTYKPVFELTPAPKSTVEDLNEMTITFPEAEKVEFVGNEISFVLTVGAYYAAPGYTCTRVNDNTFTLTLLEGAATIPTGTANLVIEEGSFELDGEASPEIRATYTIAREASTAWTTSPEKTIVYAEYGFDCAFVFEDGTQVSYPDVSKVTVTYAGNTLSSSEYMMMSESNYLMFGMYETSLLQAGEFTVDIEAGAFTISGTPNDAMTYTWDVESAKDYSSTVKPSAEGKVSDLSKITVAFPEATTAELYNNGASLRKSDYSYYCTPEIAKVEDAEYPAFEFSFDPAPVTAGTYDFTCRMGTFTLDGSQESPEVKLTYDFDKQSGIWNIGIDADTNITIVTIDGRVIAKDVPASAVTTLEKGKVYIINGVKIYLK